MVTAFSVRPATNQFASHLRRQVIGGEHKHLLAEALAQYELGETDVRNEDDYLLLLQDTMEQFEIPDAVLESVEFGDPPKWTGSETAIQSSISTREGLIADIFSEISEIEDLIYDYTYVAVVRQMDPDERVFDYEDTMADRRAYLAEKYAHLDAVDPSAYGVAEPEGNAVADEEAVG